MGGSLTADSATWTLGLAGVAVLLAVLLFYRRRRRGGRLQRMLADIAYDRIEGLVIPNGDEGEIQIDHLLLTSQGLLVIDIKEVAGTVFGSDKMQQWTVISEDRRFTFPNPQPALYDRVAAVRHIVRDVPVAGRILFLDGAEFTKGTPAHVAGIDDVATEFGEPDKSAARTRVEAFKPHWDRIRRVAAIPVAVR